MGKQPTQGQKKTKDAISKAAASKKGGKKKWSKGKVKDRVDNAVFLETEALEKLAGDVYKLGKLVTISTVVEKIKVNGSVSRALIKELTKRGLLKKLYASGKQWIYTQAQAKKEEKKEETKEKKPAGKKAGK
jgi:small subunit ribosomal protein S25e